MENSNKLDTGWYGYEGFVVKVGPQQEDVSPSSYFLHRGYACCESKYFEDLYMDLRQAIIDVDFSSERPGIVYHFVHWLYTKQVPILAEWNQDNVAVVNDLFVFAEKYQIHELAAQCYNRIRMLLGGPVATTAERVKGLYDVFGRATSMTKTFYLRLMVHSAQAAEGDVQFLNRRFIDEPEFAREFFEELEEYTKCGRAHPCHDKDLGVYLLPPLVDWWGGQELRRGH